MMCICLNYDNMIETFSGVTIYGNWDDWYLPNDEEDVDVDENENDETNY